MILPLDNGPWSRARNPHQTDHVARLCEQVDAAGDPDALDDPEPDDAWVAGEATAWMERRSVVGQRKPHERRGMTPLEIRRRLEAWREWTVRLDRMAGIGVSRTETGVGAHGGEKAGDATG